MEYFSKLHVDTGAGKRLERKTRTRDTAGMTSVGWEEELHWGDRSRRGRNRGL